MKEDTKQKKKTNSSIRIFGTRGSLIRARFPRTTVLNNRKKIVGLNAGVAYTRYVYAM